MPQSLAQIYLHLVFSTKHRLPWITREFQDPLHAYMAGICRKCGSEAYRVGGVEDHIHIACRLSRTITVAKLLEEIKKTSSAWLKTLDESLLKFSWQNGYAAFSIEQDHLETLIGYIDRQREHHTINTYKQEVLKYLQEYNVEFDIRYLWD